jgi:hypothetical protein
MQAYLILTISMLFVPSTLFCMRGTTNVTFPPGINVLATSSDGRYIASGYCDGKVYVIDLESPDNDNVKIFTSNSSVTAITCGPYIVVGCSSGDLYVLNYKLCLLSSFRAHADGICALAADESWVAALSQSGLLKVFDLDKPDLEYKPCCLSVVQSQQKINTIALNHYRGRLVFTCGCNVVIWDVMHDAALAKVCASNDDIMACTLNDSILWTAGRDKYIRAWDIISNKQLSAFKTGLMLTSLCMNKDKDLLMGVWRDKGAIAFNCLSGKRVEVAEPIYPYVSSCVVSGETVLFIQKDGDVEIQPIGLSFLFKNDLDYPIADFTFIDQDQQAHTIAKYSKAHDCVRIVLDFFLDRLCPYTLQMNVLDNPKVVVPFLKLPAVRQMCLTQYIRNARIFLELGRKFPKKTELEWKCYWPISPGLPAPIKDKNICATVLVTGVALKNLSLIDCLGQSACAQRRRKFIWDFDVISQNRPYTLLAETETEKSKWHIQNIPNESEMLISWQQHDLCLLHEFSQQIVKISQEKQGSLSSTLLCYN